MARNEEKAQLMLNKWVTMKKEFAAGHVASRRPFLASECSSLGEAEKWRLQIVRELTKKVSAIQNAGLGEHKLRDLNDQINKLLREKGHWQKRIRELGGPDYNSLEPAAIDADGRPLAGGGGYKYFGAARNLPGVKELFEAAPPTKKKRTRAELFKGITPDYYGFRDEQFVPGLLDDEARREAKFRETVGCDERVMLEERKDKERRRRALANEPALEEDSDDDVGGYAAMLAHVDRLTDATRLGFEAHHQQGGPPKQPDPVHAALLATKKRDLLAFLAESAAHDDEDDQDDDEDVEHVD